MFKTLAVLILFLFACGEAFRKKGTPDQYVNNVKINPVRYSRDSAAIVDSLYIMLKNHEASFGNKEYYDSTVLIVDSILYDSSLDKIAVFVVAKNPTHRNPYSESKLPYYYNANAYLGRRLESDSSRFELRCLCRFSMINFDDYKTVIDALKQDFFEELATVKDAYNQPIFKYNLDDKRFWDSATGWNSTFK